VISFDKVLLLGPVTNYWSAAKMRYEQTS